MTSKRPALKPNWTTDRAPDPQTSNPQTGLQTGQSPSPDWTGLSLKLLRRPLLDLLARQLLDPRPDPPLIARGILDACVAIAVELVDRRKDRLRARGDRLLVEGVGIVHVEIEHRRIRLGSGLGFAQHQ